MGKDGILYVTGMLRIRHLPGRRDEMIVQTVKADGPECTARFAQDPSQAGKSQIDSLRRQLSFHTPFRSKPVVKNKEFRAREALRLAEFGKIKIVPFPGFEILLDELCSFPHAGSGMHDDCVDALSDLVDELVTGSSYDASAIARGFGRMIGNMTTDSLEQHALRTYRG